MDKKDIYENNEEKNEENYRFVKQVIKKKTIQPKDILIRIGCIVGSAVLFGIIAAFVFVQFIDIVDVPNQEQETLTQIDLGEDTDEIEVVVEPTPTVTPTPESGAVDQGSQDTESQEESMIAAYNAMYEEMQQVAQDAMTYMVTITGINSEEDWFAVQSDSSKQASGVIIAQNESAYYILTEYKTVDIVERIVVAFCDGTMTDGRYLMHDPNTGLTILKVDKLNVTVATKGKIKVAPLGNSYRTMQGDAVIAIGSPMGYSNSIVYGQITSTTNTIATWDKQYNLLTTSMLGNSSGNGVLINLDGHVVGILAQDLELDSYENMIVAFPISQLKGLIERLSNSEPLPCLGIKGQNVTDEVANQTGMPKGIYVTAVKSKSPVFDAGIRNGDIITMLNDHEISSMSEYTELLYEIEPGTVVNLKIMRKSTEGYREFDFDVVSATW